MEKVACRKWKFSGGYTFYHWFVTRRDSREQRNIAACAGRRLAANDARSAMAIVSLVVYYLRAQLFVAAQFHSNKETS
ncbi:hypothetical protein PWR63_01505 [Paraburkholderia sp. A2WS-5]|uniref:hypothetical protein n=1 Tax=unclassified Paraburkholderia TaxID=2615204 RepID=UPI003B81BB5A